MSQSALEMLGEQLGPTLDEPTCIVCRVLAINLAEYEDAALGELPNAVPDAALTDGEKEKIRDFVRDEEGTYNAANGHFVCTPCYVKIGCPSSPTGWVAP